MVGFGFLGKAVSYNSHYNDPKSNLVYLITLLMYSLIQMKCQGGNKYALSITVKLDQSTRRFGRICLARLSFTAVYERFKKCQKEYAYY